MSSVLRVTKDYSKFEPLPQNRNVKPKRAARLRESMRKHGYIYAYPIHCVPNGHGKLRIKDGHYRFQEAQALGLPIAYVVCKDEATLNELVCSNIRWNLQDYLDSYVNAGVKPYVELNEYIDRTGIPTSKAVNLFAGSSNSSHDAGGNALNNFKDGKFKCVEKKDPSIIAELVLLCKNKGVTFASTNAFVSALYRIIKAEGFNMDRMKMKIKSHHHRMRRQVSIDDYVALFERIYNFHVSPEEIVPLAINTKKAMKEKGNDQA